VDQISEVTVGMSALLDRLARVGIRSRDMFYRCLASPKPYRKLSSCTARPIVRSTVQARYAVPLANLFSLKPRLALENPTRN
jgi:hypothetical protein